MRDFNFGNAFMHFARTDGPSGFIWKFVLSYGAAFAGFVLLQSVLFGGAAFALLGGPNVSTGGLGSVTLLSLLMWPLAMLLAAMFEAAYQRRYMRGEVFRLRLGGDEWRLCVVYLIWLTVLILFYIIIGSALLAVTGSFAGVGSASAIGLTAILTTLAITGGWIYVVVRLAPASALTIRDKSIRFRSAWRVTRGRFWTLLGSYLVLFFSAFLIYLIAMILMGLFYSSIVYAGISSTDAASPLSNPGVWVGFALTFLGVFCAYGWFSFVWAGPAAMAARTDPERAHMDNPAAAFQ